MTSTTVTERTEPGLPIGEDGYGRMDYRMTAEKWSPLPSWGRDGWDLGSWPLVTVRFRGNHEDGFELLYDVEGDVTSWSYAGAGAWNELVAKVDSIAIFHWRHEEAEWLAGVPEGEEPDYLKGPYSSARYAEREA